MDTEIQENSQDNELESNEVSEITTPPSEGSPDSQIEIDQEQQPASGEGEEQPAPYEPNFKYNVLGMEKEFDDRLKGVIKSKEDEEWLRDVMTRADGFENDKKSYKQLRKDYEYIDSQFKQMSQDVNQVLEMRDKGDVDSLIHVLGVKPEQIEQWFYRQQQYKQLTPEQKNYYDNQRERDRSFYSLEKQNQELNQRLQQIELQTRQSELINKMNNSEFAPVIREFDSRNGQDAFMKEVIRRGYAYETTGQTKSMDDVIQEVASFLTFNQPQQTPSPSGSAQATKVIPNTGSGGSQAPVKRKPKDLDELRAMIGE